VREASPTPPESRYFFKFKETEQYHVSMGSLGIPARSEDRYAMAALNNVLGGGMSSRLFQEVREKRGLAYAVYSYHQGYSDAGAIKTYVGSTTGNVEEAIRVIVEQLGRIMDEAVGAELLTPEEISARIEAVTPQDIARLAKQHLRTDQMYLSAVGPKELDLGRYLN
jgi:predicted Zn-dependent peptidase